MNEPASSPRKDLTRDDVVAAVDRCFPGGNAATVLGILDLYGIQPYERERERVQLAILTLCEGDEDQLLSLVGTAKKDYRDILSWVETGPLPAAEGERLRVAALALIKRWGKP